MYLEVRPLGRRLGFSRGENLLDVLMRENVPVSYSCTAGRCGTCRCKVLDGDVDERLAIAPHLLPADGVRRVLACQTWLDSDCVIEIPEPDEVVVHPAKVLKATVVEIHDATHDIRVLRLKPAKSLAFAPGQYATLQFSPEYARQYSMAGLDHDELLEFHVRLVPNGRVSGYVANSLSVGDTVRVSGPLGTSYLRRKHEGPMICVAGGTGLAPVLSIVRGALESGMRNPIHVYFGVRSEQELYGDARLADLSERYSNLHFHIVVSSGDVRDGHRRGLVTEAVAQDWPVLEGWRAYLCGAPIMVDAARGLLVNRGVNDDHIYADAFYTNTN